MFRRMFRRRMRSGACAEESGRGLRAGCCARPLSDFSQGVEVAIVVNRDRKTLEMGMCAGAVVRVLENRPGDANMVIAAGEGRYILAKETASQIRVR